MEYIPDELKLSRINSDELEANQRFVYNMKNTQSNININTAAWFVPNFTHVLKGGLRTIFMLAEKMSCNNATHNVFIIDNFFNREVKSDLQTQITKHFPDLKYDLIIFNRDGAVEELPEADVGVCTLWVTAYTLAKYNQCKAKYYFMQDFEPEFYPSGSISSLIEHTYRLGFYFIANTPGVAQKFRKYSEWGMSFVPAVDKKIFYPNQKQVKKNGPYNIVFYARPKNERNCFIMGVEALRIVQKRMGSKVRIACVGAEFQLEDYNLQGVLSGRGLLDSMDEVAELYRNSDLGISFMTTPHPSYQPFEYMASGCPALTNINESNNWLYQDKENIVLSEPIYNVIADKIIATLEDVELRQNLIKGGLETVSTLNWNRSLSEIIDYMHHPKKYMQIA